MFKSIDCHVIENATRHITKQYEQTKEQPSAHISSAPRNSTQRSSAPQIPSAEENVLDSLDSPDMPDNPLTASVNSTNRDSLARQSIDSHDVPLGISVLRPDTAFLSTDAHLVVRRGQRFTIELAFDRPYDRFRDDIILTFEFGKTTNYHNIMGVDHGGQVPPREFGLGDANANMLYCHSLHKGAFCGLQNAPKSVFGRGTAPDPTGGAHDALQTRDSIASRLERGHPSPYFTPLGTDPPSALAMRTREFHAARSYSCAHDDELQFKRLLKLINQSTYVY